MDIDVTENDLDYLVKIGCMEPDISGGLNTSLRYKRLVLRASFAMSFGAQALLPDFFATAELRDRNKMHPVICLNVGVNRETRKSRIFPRSLPEIRMK